MYPVFYSCLFNNISLWEEVAVGQRMSHDNVVLERGPGLKMLFSRCKKTNVFDTNLSTCQQK